MDTTFKSLEHLVSLFLAATTITRAVHTVAAVEIFHAEVAYLCLTFNDAIASNVCFFAALQPMSASIVELTAANADVASFTICGARLALTIISTHVWRAAVIIGSTLCALGMTCLGLALFLLC